jgi:hypothetical protein
MKPERIYVQWEGDGDLEAYAYLDHLEAAEAKNTQSVLMQDDPGWVKRKVATEEEFWKLVHELSDQGYTVMGGPYVPLWQP